MVDTAFFNKKYSLDNVVAHYLEEIKNLRVQVANPSDETKLQAYYQAASSLLRLSTKDIYQFITSYDKASGKAALMRKAFPCLLGNTISNPSLLDLAYLRLLLAYILKFKATRANLKDWLLRFLLSSPFSPLSGFIEREINSAIAQTEQKIAKLQFQIK